MKKANPKAAMRQSRREMSIAKPCLRLLALRIPCGKKADTVGDQTTKHAPAEAVSSTSGRLLRGGGDILDLALIFVVSLGAFVWLVIWLDNPQALTSNGVFKAMTVRSWISDWRSASLDPSNYLYYPIAALFCRALDLIGVLPGDPRRQLAIINCIFASATLCTIYSLARSVTADRATAWIAALFHAGCAFFLNLAISNEDIMPSYALLMGAMALASIWFAAPTRTQVAIVSLVFTLSWLMEWRLMFPTLPALLAALAIGHGRLAERAARLGIFLLTMVGTAQLIKMLWGPQNANPGSVIELLWTAKGVDSGWAGFAERKLVFLWAGISEYLLGGKNLGDVSYIAAHRPEMIVATVLIIALAVPAAILLWQRRRDVSSRALATVFGVTFAAGEAFNFYSQPQDPQMQVNVMPWLTVAFFLVVATASRCHRVAVPALAVAFCVGLLSYNIYRMTPARGQDSLWRGALQRIEQQIDPTRTVFLVHGFEQIVSEMFYEWSGDWNYFPRLGPAPADKPKVKLLAFVSGPVHRPAASGQELADELSNQISRAMDLGYDIIADYIWEVSEESFIAYMSTILEPARAAILYRVLHERFVGRKTFTDPVAGPFFLLRKAG